MSEVNKLPFPSNENFGFLEPLEITIREDILSSEYVHQLLRLLSLSMYTDYEFEKASIGDGLEPMSIRLDRDDTGSYEPNWWWLTEEYGWVSSQFLESHDWFIKPVLAE